MSTRKMRLLKIGALGVAIDAATSLNVYLLSLNGDWSQLNWTIIFTGTLTALLVGASQLKDFLLEEEQITLPPSPKPSPLDDILP